MDTEQRIARFEELIKDNWHSEDAIEQLAEEVSDDEFKPYHVDTVDEDSGRWYRHMLEVFEIDEGIYVGVRYESGLTEYQENMYDDKKVYRLKKTTKIIIDWIG